MKILILFLSAGVLFAEPAEKSYFGGWPVNLEKSKLSDSGFKNPCPGEIGCECNSNADCKVGTCFKMPRGQWCSPDIGVQVPNYKTIDQYGEEVELYDFSADNLKLVDLFRGHLI